MSQVICIPCLNLRMFDFDYVLHRHSKAKCASCGATGRQGLLISIIDFETECIDQNGCDNVKIKFICDKTECEKI